MKNNRILVSDLLKSCNYKKSYFDKMLTKLGISNHFELSKQDLIILYNSLKVMNHKSFLLRTELEELL